MRFSFPLQTLLNWRQKLEEFSQIRLAEKTAQLHEQAAAIAHLGQKREETDRELHLKSSQGISGAEFRLYRDFAEETLHGLARMQSKKEEKAREVEEERKNYFSLRRQRQILERLKEKKFKKFLSQAERAAQKETDERVLQGRIRPRG